MRRILEVCAIFSACFLITIDGQTPSVRPSYCRRPDLLPLVCNATCVDIDCVDGQLCCPNLCGNGMRVCSDPLLCPPISATPPAAGGCTSECNNNVDCTGGLICCLTGCATPQCVVPFTTTVAPPTTTPSPPTSTTSSPLPTTTTSVPTQTPSPFPDITSSPLPSTTTLRNCHINGCPHGYVCWPEGQCLPSCVNFDCPPGYLCELREVQCLAPPCFTTPICVLATTTRPPPLTTTTRPPPLTCANFDCPPGYLCELQEVQCVAPPCSATPVCILDRCFGISCGPNAYCQDGVCTSDCYPFNTGFTGLCGELDQLDQCAPEEVCLTSARTGQRVCCRLPEEYEAQGLLQQPSSSATNVHLKLVYVLLTLAYSAFRGFNAWLNLHLS